MSPKTNSRRHTHTARETLMMTGIRPLCLCVRGCVNLRCEYEEIRWTQGLKSGLHLRGFVPAGTS